MATAYIAFGGANDKGVSVPNVSPTQAETIASGSATSIAAQNEQIISVTAIGGDIWIAAGAAPVAAPNSGRRIRDGDTMHLGGVSPGMKIATIDA